MRNHGDQSARGRNKASQWGDAPQGNSYDSHSGGRRGESSQFRSRAYTQNNPNRSRPSNRSHTTSDSRSISEKLEGREGRPQGVRTSYRNSYAAHTGGGTEKAGGRKAEYLRWTRRFAAERILRRCEAPRMQVQYKANIVCF